MSNYKTLLAAAATAALPLLPPAAAAQDYGGSEIFGNDCMVMASETCLVATYNEAAGFAVNQMTALYNRDGFVPAENLDILDINNLVSHWQDCQPISGVNPLADVERHLDTPAYCLTAVRDFAEKFGGEYDAKTTNAWLAHIDTLRQALSENEFQPRVPDKLIRHAPAKPLPQIQPQRFQF